VPVKFKVFETIQSILCCAQCNYYCNPVISTQTIYIHSHDYRTLPEDKLPGPAYFNEALRNHVTTPYFTAINYHIRRKLRIMLAIKYLFSKLNPFIIIQTLTTFLLSARHPVTRLAPVAH